jgi:hypothetical protein
MTPTERAALLLKVQRALDAAGIGRENYDSDWNYSLEIGNDMTAYQLADGNTLVRKGKSIPVEKIATFTYDKLFPELEWGRCAHGAQGVRVGTIHFGISGDDPECLRVSDPHYTVFIPLGTPERAKRAAQSIADLLAEAGRVEQ